MFQSARTDIYLSEFAELCEHFATVSVSWEDFWEVKGAYDFVHLHWPEYYFSWKEPTIEELTNLDSILNKWNKRSTLIITRHNYYPHSGQTENYNALYKTFFKHVHIVQHLGSYSKDEFNTRYAGEEFLKTLKHYVVPHHFFYSYPTQVGKQEARRLLKIPADCKVMTVFGNVRTADERKLIAKAFQLINFKKKILLVPRWFNSQPGKLEVFREGLSLFGLSFIRQYFSGGLRLGAQFVHHNKVQLYFKAADFVFISRLHSLNSGIPFMRAQFNVAMAGPGTGNVTESMKLTGGLIYDPENLSQIAEAINDTISGRSLQQLPVMENDEVIAGLKLMYVQSP